MTYVVYNYTGQTQTVTFSNGQAVNAQPNGFTVTTGN